MASKGPKADAATPVASARANTPVAKPATAKRAAAMAVPAPKPPTAKPTPTVIKPEPAATPPVPAALAAAPVVATAPAPVAVAPVITPELPKPAAPAASLEKDVIMETATDKTQAQAQAMFNDATDRTKSAMEKGSKMLADMNDFSKGNIEAMVESSKIAAKGAEDVARYTADYARGTVEKANATARQLAAVKSPTELLKLQNEFAKDAMDTMMAETAKFTENYLKLLGEIAQPISNRVAIAAEKMKIAA